MNESLKNCARFHAAFPDDAEWSSTEDLINPGGKHVVCAMIEGLRQHSGLQCSPPEQHSFYAWKFIVAVQGQRVLCLVQDIQPWLLITESVGALRLLFWKRSVAAHRKVVEALARVMEDDKRFSEVVWISRQGI